MGTSLLRAAAVVAVALAFGSATALAAPPADPPGRSGDAPGHQKGEGSPAVDPSRPGHADEVAEQPAPPAATVVPAQAPAPSSAPVSPQSPRFDNAAGKPKVNVPPAAEAAPESSISAPGASGRHKLTICHKGHAITVDVHAAQAHVEGHGDTYAAAGAKGRAACPQPSVSVPPARPSTPSNPAIPSARASTARVERSAVEHAQESAPVAEAAAGTPARTHDPAGGVSAAASGERGGVAAAVAGDTLPFTGAPLSTLLLVGLALVALGAALLAAAGQSPARARRR